MKVVIIDDDQLVSMSLKIILEKEPDIEITAIGNDGADALPLYRTYHPDVLLMDIRMQGMNGTDALQEVLQEFPDAKVLFLTTFVDDEYIVKALEYGAKGYIIKQNYAHIVPAIHAVYSGNNTGFDYAAFDITDKEYEIITFVAEGLSNREIATKLYLSEGTIRNYLSSILEKLQLRDRTQLAVFYYQHQ